MIMQDFPLVDLHRHLDGNINIETIIELAKKYHVSLPATDTERLRPYVQVMDAESDLLDFLAKLDIGVSVLGSPDACQRVAFDNVKSVFDACLNYAELRFSPGYMAQAHNLPLPSVVEAVIDGIRQGTRLYPVHVKLIGIMSRTFGPESCMAELEAIKPFRQDIIAMDLAGDELNFPCHLFIPHFKKARDYGFHITVHAGEAAGPQSIRDAIDLLGAERIGHGIRAIEDPALMDYLAHNEIALECCLTSNLQTSTVKYISQHPLKRFLQHGIIATLNTDDPAVQGIDIYHEYTRLAPLAGLNANELNQLQHNGLNAAFLSKAERHALRIHHTDSGGL